MYVEYSTVCATSASGAHNLGGGVRGVRKSRVRISPLPYLDAKSMARGAGHSGRSRERGPQRQRSWRQPRSMPRSQKYWPRLRGEGIRDGVALQIMAPAANVRPAVQASWSTNETTTVPIFAVSCEEQVCGMCMLRKEGGGAQGALSVSTAPGVFCDQPYFVCTRFWFVRLFRLVIFDCVNL